MTTQDAHKTARQGARLGVTLAVIAVLGGCAMQPASHSRQAGSVVAGADSGTRLGANLSGFLAQSSGGAVIQLDESPWGDDVEVQADSVYFAASGRPCRALSIRRANRQAEQGAIACETAAGDWVTHRQVTQALTRGANR